MPKGLRCTCISKTTRHHVVHVVHVEDEVLLVIRDGSIYAGSIAANKLTTARVWVASRVETLLGRWTDLGGAQ